MDLGKALMDWGPVILAGILIPVARLSMKAGLVSREDFDKYRQEHDRDHAQIGERLAGGDVRFTKLEGILAHMPTQETISALNIQLAHIGREIEALRGEMKQASVVVEYVRRDAGMLLQTHLEPR